MSFISHVGCLPITTTQSYNFQFISAYSEILINKLIYMQPIYPLQYLYLTYSPAYSISCQQHSSQLSFNTIQFIPFISILFKLYHSFQYYSNYTIHFNTIQNIPFISILFKLYHSFQYHSNYTIHFNTIQSSFAFFGSLEQYPNSILLFEDYLIAINAIQTICAIKKNGIVNTIQIYYSKIVF